MEERLIVDIRCRRAVLGDLLQEPVAPVRVHHRIDQDHQVVKQLGDVGAGAGDQVVEERQGAVGAGRLVTMNRIG